MFAQSLLVYSALAATVLAHMKMTSPVPYNYDGINNSPLDPSGSDFPCKGVDYSKVTKMNEFKAGSKGKLEFIGTAVHGGGSCQISVTYDDPPTKDSAWKVIHSIEGGCPARNTPGNLPGNDASLPAPDSYEFTVPKLPDGKATLAWTWFNKVGNREMYMNCAPVTITGGGNADILNTLPDMFKANIGALGKNCETTHGTNVVFPDPGNSVDHPNGDADKAPPANCPSKGGDRAPAPVPTQAPAPAPTKVPAPAPTRVPVPKIPGGVFLPESPKSPEAPVQTVAPAAPAPAPAAGAGVQSGPCTQEGIFNCIGGTAFQRCASGIWSPAQPVAAGTICAGGMAMDLKVSAA